jgi:hypothetical protein
MVVRLTFDFEIKKKECLKTGWQNNSRILAKIIITEEAVFLAGNFLFRSQKQILKMIISKDMTRDKNVARMWGIKFPTKFSSGNL